MRSNIVETIVGGIVLVVAGLFLSFAYKASGTMKSGGYELQAKFDRIDGLVSGNDVRLSGVKVGQVTTINIDPKSFLAVVRMSIEPTVELPTDSSVEIVSESLMGGKYLALVPGAADEIMKPGDTILHTQSSISLEGLIGKFMFSKSDDEKKSEGKK